MEKEPLTFRGTSFDSRGGAVSDQSIHLACLVGPEPDDKVYTTCLRFNRLGVRRKWTDDINGAWLVIGLWELASALNCTEILQGHGFNLWGKYVIYLSLCRR